MKKILFYFYNEEIGTDSTTSVTRLVASLAKSLQGTFAVSYFSFQHTDKEQLNDANQIFLNIPSFQRLKRKVNNALRFKRVQWFHLKRNAVRSFSRKNKTAFDAVIVLGLDDVREARNFFPQAKILYWIHNISAICKEEYLYNVNDADHFLSPSLTTYHLLLQKLQPKPLTAEFHFMPNWCEDVFKQNDIEKVRRLRDKHNITPNAYVFIFSGSDLKLKGKFIINRVIKKLSHISDKELIFIFAGSNHNQGEYKYENIRVIDVGLLKPDMLASYYQLSSFGLISSLAYDHCPLVLLEMVQCNVLPIASDIGGIKEMLGGEYPYLISEPHSVSAWIHIITKAIALTSEDKNQIATNLKGRFTNIYTKDTAVQTITDIVYTS